MRLTEHKLNILKILHYDLNSFAPASEVEKQFKKIYGRDIGNIYTDLRDLIKLGLVAKDELSRVYSATEKGKEILSVKCGDPPTLELVYNGILIERIKLYEQLFLAIQDEAKKDGLKVEEWVIDVLEIATGVHK